MAQLGAHGFSEATARPLPMRSGPASQPNDTWGDASRLDYDERCRP